MEKRKAVGYKRVSTVGQAVNGVSMDAQDEAIKRFCALNDYELVGVYEDAGISGTRRDIRPGVATAIRLACEHKAVLVFYSLSRLARSTKDCLAIVEELRKGGADFAAIDMPVLNTASATGQLILSIFAAFSQFERDATAERTRIALQHKRARGEIYGQVPYGKARGPAARNAAGKTSCVLVDDPQEQAVLRFAHERRRLGETYQGIADELNELGLRTRRGSEWTRARVHQICSR